MASLDLNAQLLPLPAPQLPAQRVDALMVVAPTQPVRDDSLASPAMARPAPHPGAILRSRSNHSSERRNTTRRQGAASRVRRALPSAFAEAADLGIVVQLAVPRGAVAPAPQVPEVHSALVARGRPEPDRAVIVQQRETNRRHEVHIDIMRSELNAAMQLMEHRERWWTTGLHNAEAAVGLELGRVHASEVAAAEGMEAQMASLLGVLRTTQSRAEDSSLAALEQRKLASDLDLYATRFTAQGRMMINNSEQKQWHLVSEMNASRAELARVKTEAENIVNVALLQQNARLANAEAAATNAVLRAQSLEAEIRSVRTEADELSASRLQHGLEAEINLETLRGEKQDSEVRFNRRIEALTAELAQRSSRQAAAEGETTQSAATLQELLRDAQNGWSKAAANWLTITASSEKMRAELDSSVGSSVCKPSNPFVLLYSLSWLPNKPWPSS